MSRPAVLILAVLAALAALAVLGTLGLRGDGSDSTGPVAARPVPVPAPVPAGCPAPAAPGERVLCASDTDVLTGHGQRSAALRVELDQVIAQLQDAATASERAPAVGSGCAPPARGDGIGAPAWRCSVFFTGPPPVTVHYRLVVRPGGCWSATPVLTAAVQGRGIARRYAGCGLRVGP